MAGRILKITKGGESTSPGGNNTEVQYNNAGDFGGCAQLFWDSANDRLGLGDNAPARQLSITKCMKLLVSSASDVGVIYKGANRFIHDYKAVGADGCNVFVGRGSGNFSMAIAGAAHNASDNVGLGYRTLESITSGYRNVGIGSRALEAITTGARNLGIGFGSLLRVTSGENNCGISASAATHITTGSDNLAIGYGALQYSATGNKNVAIGQYAGRCVAGHSVSNNTVIGASAGYALITGGDNNIMIGYQAGDNVTSGEQNIIIGYNLDALAVASDYQLNIGSLIFGDLGGTKKVGVNTSTMNETLNVGGAIRLGTSALTNDGTIRWTGTDFEGYMTGWRSLTVQRLKEFFIPVTSGVPDDVLADREAYGAGRSLDLNDCSHITFRVPSDFSSITTATIVIIPGYTTSAANWDIYTDYAATGQGFQTHSQSNTATTYNVTNGIVYELNIAGVLTSLAANDYVGVKLKQANATHDLNVLGVRFRYS